MRSPVIFNKHIAVSCCDGKPPVRVKGPWAIKQGGSPTYRLFSDKFNAGAGGITVSTNRDGHFVVRTVFRIEYFNSTLLPFYFVRAKISSFCCFLVVFPGVCLSGSLQDGIFINSGRLFPGKNRQVM